MTYESVGQIYDCIDETRARLYTRVEGLGEERAGARPNEDAWSVSEIMEHLSIIELLMVRNLKGLLAKAEAGHGEGDATAMKPFSLDQYIERARGSKFTAPEVVRPSGGVALEESLARLRRSREELKALRQRIESVDLSNQTSPHPAFGPLDGYQWLAFVGLHEERHLRQIESLLAP